MARRAPAGYRFVQGRPERPVHLIEAGRRDDAGGTTGRSLCGLWSGWSPETTSATWRQVVDELPEGGRPRQGCAARLRLRGLPVTPRAAQLRLL